MIQTSVPRDWNSFSQHLGLLYPEQINHLKELTRNHLKAGNSEKQAQFIKVVYVDHYNEASSSDPNEPKKPPRVVLWEAHPAVRGLDLGWKRNATTIGTLKRSLRDVNLPPTLGHMQTEFYFASMPLRGQRGHADDESLQLYLIFYCDKIYATPLLQSANETWQKYKDYFKKAQDMILADPALYIELCRKLKNLFTTPDQPLDEEVYRYLVMLRSLPESLAYSPNGYVAAAESVRELLALLDLLETREKNKSTMGEEAIYNVINALEWLAYLVPKMYEVQLPGPPLYEDLVNSLEKYIIEKRYKLAIRLEAAWTLGWASVSSIAVATRVHRYEKSAKSRIHKLNSNLLKQVVGVAYLRASFTLVSFGPARATPGAEKLTLPGAYLPEQAFPQVNDYARQAASDVLYDGLASIVGGGTQFLWALLTMAALWLGVDGLLATLLLQDVHSAVVAWISIPPTMVLLLTVPILTVLLWGRGYWLRIVVILATSAALAISPWIGIANWQLIFVIAGAFAALLGTIVVSASPWVTIITALPLLLKILRSSRLPYGEK